MSKHAQFPFSLRSVLLVWRFALSANCYMTRTMHKIKLLDEPKVALKNYKTCHQNQTVLGRVAPTLIKYDHWLNAWFVLVQPDLSLFLSESLNLAMDSKIPQAAHHVCIDNWAKLKKNSQVAWHLISAILKLCRKRDRVHNILSENGNGNTAQNGNRNRNRIETEITLLLTNHHLC